MPEIIPWEDSKLEQDMERYYEYWYGDVWVGTVEDRTPEEELDYDWEDEE